MKERILEFLKAENKSSAQLAEEIGVQPSGISHILSGRNNPSLDFIMKMIERYQFLSMDWLLFGKGNMYRDQSMQDLFTESTDLNVKADSSVESKRQVAPEPEVLSKKSFVDLKHKGTLEKIVLFYSDRTFTEYFPENGGDNK